MTVSFSTQTSIYASGFGWNFYAYFSDARGRGLC